MIGDFFATLAIWFLVLSIGAGASVIGFSILAPLFMENDTIHKQERYIKITEKGHDFDEDN
jgi:NADH:ubiquinone oxidoreductase subunit K